MNPRSTTAAIEKKAAHNKASSSPTLIRAAHQPSVFAPPLSLLSRVACFLAGVEPEGSNAVDKDYVKSHAYDTDLFVQTN